MQNDGTQWPHVPHSFVKAYDLCRCDENKMLAVLNPEPVDRQLFELAIRNKWKQCPGCTRMVDKREGCFYMICRCGARFCYDCGVRVILSPSRALISVRM